MDGWTRLVANPQNRRVLEVLRASCHCQGKRLLEEGAVYEARQHTWTPFSGDASVQTKSVRC